MERRRVLVSGAGSATGIGFAIARAFASAGAAVFITGASQRIHDRAKEIGAGSSVADLTDSAEATRVVEEATAALGGIDILVNNAGMTSVLDPAVGGRLDQFTDVQWTHAIARNLDSAAFLTRAALPYLRLSGSGRVIVIGSSTGPVQAMRGDIAYATAKAALTGFVRALALDEAQHGITVNAIAPGWIATESQTAHEAAQGKATPVGRSGRPEEIASAVQWLAGVDAGFTTGQVIVIDGGNSIAEERG
jgi:3-oxoacyl-[acyl-carrier protein] reductase